MDFFHFRSYIFYNFGIIGGNEDKYNSLKVNDSNQDDQDVLQVSSVRREAS